MSDTRTEDLRQMKRTSLRALRSLNAALGPRGALETEDNPSRGVWLFEDGDDDFYANAAGGPLLAGYVCGRGDGWTVFNPDGTVDEVASGPETGAKARRLVEEAWNRACLASPEYRSKAREGEEEATTGGEARRTFWRAQDGDDDFYEVIDGEEQIVGYVSGSGKGWEVYKDSGCCLYAGGPETGLEGRRLVERAVAKMRAEQRGEPDGEEGALAERVAKLESEREHTDRWICSDFANHDGRLNWLEERAVELKVLTERVGKLEHNLGSWAYWNFADMADRLDGLAERLSAAGRIASGHRESVESKLADVSVRLDDLHRREGNLRVVLEEHDSRISAGEEHHRAKFDNLNLRLAGLESKLGLWGSVHFAEHHERLDDLERRVGDAHDRMEGIEDEAVKAGIVANRADERASIANARQVAVERRLSEVVERLEKLEQSYGYLDTVLAEHDEQLDAAEDHIDEVRVVASGSRQLVDGRLDRLTGTLEREKNCLRRVIEIVGARLDGLDNDGYPISETSRGLLRVLDGEAEDV